jgi:RNA polymerase sigma factor (sigma-70 family)
LARRASFAQPVCAAAQILRDIPFCRLALCRPGTSFAAVKFSSPADSPDTPQPGAGPGQQAAFVTTHWSVVLRARDRNSPTSDEALETLCRTYWFPLYAFVRRLGHNPHDAQDLTQEFFARLLQKHYLKSAEREKGRFRTFLLVALKRFLADAWDRQHAQKRGGFASVVSINQEMAESRFASEPAHSLQPDVLFDRQWAMTLLDRTISLLHDEYVATGRAALFEALRACLGREESALPYAEIAAQLKLTEGAVKMAVRRLRTRYREILRAEIAGTVASPDEIEEEIRHLFAAFGP